MVTVEPLLVQVLEYPGTPRIVVSLERGDFHHFYYNVGLYGPCDFVRDDTPAPLTGATVEQREF